MKRPPPRTACDQGRTAPRTSYRIPLPPGCTPLEVAIDILECLVKEHGAVVTGTDLGPDGTGSYTIHVPAAAAQPEG